jgi:hypothetical protein
MSGLSFRPRPIDISKPIPIIRADSEDYEEIIKLAVTVPKIATGMDPEDEEVCPCTLPRLARACTAAPAMTTAHTRSCTHSTCSTQPRVRGGRVVVVVVVVWWTLLQEKHIQEAIKRSLHAQANPSDYAIPTPTFKIVEEPDEPPFERKTSYIHFHGALSCLWLTPGSSGACPGLCMAATRRREELNRGFVTCSAHSRRAGHDRGVRSG